MPITVVGGTPVHPASLPDRKSIFDYNSMLATMKMLESIQNQKTLETQRKAATEKVKLDMQKAYEERNRAAFERAVTSEFGTDPKDPTAYMGQEEAFRAYNESNQPRYGNKPGNFLQRILGRPGEEVMRPPNPSETDNAYVRRLMYEGSIRRDMAMLDLGRIHGLQPDQTYAILRSGGGPKDITEAAAKLRKGGTYEETAQKVRSEGALAELRGAEKSRTVQQENEIVQKITQAEKMFPETFRAAQAERKTKEEEAAFKEETHLPRVSAEYSKAVSEKAKANVDALNAAYKEHFIKLESGRVQAETALKLAETTHQTALTAQARAEVAKINQQMKTDAISLDIAQRNIALRDLYNTPGITRAQQDQVIDLMVANHAAKDPVTARAISQLPIENRRTVMNMFSAAEKDREEAIKLAAAKNIPDSEDKAEKVQKINDSRRENLVRAHVNARADPMTPVDLDSTGWIDNKLRTSSTRVPLKDAANYSTYWADAVSPIDPNVEPDIEAAVQRRATAATKVLEMGYSYLPMTASDSDIRRILTSQKFAGMDPRVVDKTLEFRRYELDKRDLARQQEEQRFPYPIGPEQPGSLPPSGSGSELEILQPLMKGPESTGGE
jgi:hypothetical protein